VTKTLLIDGNSLLKYGFHGLKYLKTSDKLAAVYFFLNTIRKYISEEGYNKVFVAWDGIKNYEYRRNIYSQYKIQRKQNNLSEEELFSLNSQRLRIKQYLEEVYVRQYEFEGYEADDCIAYYCNNTTENVTIITNDRDLVQLVRPNVSIKFLNPPQVFTHNDKVKYQGVDIPIQNIKLIKILCGDSSDNISGVKGLGVKTLIKHFPNILSKTLSLDSVLTETINILEDNPKNFRLKNLVEGVTKDGVLGSNFLDRNIKLVDLSSVSYPPKFEVEMNQIMTDTLDPEGRSYKNLLKMMIKDNLFEFIGKSDNSFLNFVQPFILLTRVEKNKFKKK
jgi:DNA polymerase-1